MALRITTPAQRPSRYRSACDNNACDLLDYFADDSETDVTTASIEGIIERGRSCRWLESMRQIGQTDLRRLQRCGGSL